jgi:FKBP12-rapamycin binding domain
VSRELIRVAILWHEQWHEGLEEASRYTLYSTKCFCYSLCTITIEACTALDCTPYVLSLLTVVLLPLRVNHSVCSIWPSYLTEQTGDCASSLLSIYVLS